MRITSSPGSVSAKQGVEDRVAVAVGDDDLAVGVVLRAAPARDQLGDRLLHLVEPGERAGRSSPRRGRSPRVWPRRRPDAAGCRCRSSRAAARRGPTRPPPPRGRCRTRDAVQPPSHQAIIGDARLVRAANGHRHRQENQGVGCPRSQHHGPWRVCRSGGPSGTRTAAWASVLAPDPSRARAKRFGAARSTAPPRSAPGSARSAFPGTPVTNDPFS